MDTTALHLACNELLFHRIIQLVQDGANPNVMNLLGETPLTCVISNSYKAPELATFCVAVLLLAGADPNLHAKGSFTPLMLTAIHQNTAILKLLLDSGVNVNTLYQPAISAVIPYGSSALSIAFQVQNNISFLVPLVYHLHDPNIFLDAFRYCTTYTHTQLAE